MENDIVNHPGHYCQDGAMECIDEMVAIFGKIPTRHFCLLNVWKYRKRAVYKKWQRRYEESRLVYE